MKQETFRYLWKQGVEKAAKSVIEEIGSAEQEKYHVVLDTSDKICEKVYQRYDELRLLVREKYFHVGDAGEKKIDGHKICACITGALLDIPLVSFDVDKIDMPKVVFYSNYAIDFLASIYILYLFLLSDYDKDGRDECYKELVNQATFAFPQTNQGHDPYLQGRIKTLALNDINGNDFDILSYADMLFWIEKYNKDLICEKIKNKKNKEK